MLIPNMFTDRKKKHPNKPNFVKLNSTGQLMSTLHIKDISKTKWLSVVN